MHQSHFVSKLSRARLQHARMLLLFLTFQITSALAFLPKNYEPHNLGWLFGFGSRTELTETETSVCESAECRTIAKIFTESMNKTVDPCKNFYKYACGNWSVNNPIPPKEESWSFWQKTQMSLLDQVLEMMKTDSDPKDMMAIKLAKRYYRACQDEKRRDELGLEPVYTVLAKIGGWPMIMELGEWNEDRYSWQTVDDYYARLVGENAFHAVSVFKENNETLLMISAAPLPSGSNKIWMTDSINDEYVLEEESEEQDSDERDSQEYGTEGNNDEKVRMRNLKKKPREIYADLVAEVAMAIAEVIGAKLSKERLSKDIDDMLTFMNKLEDAKFNNEDINMSLLDLDEWYNGLKKGDNITKINWLNKIMLLFEEIDMEVDSNLKIKLSNVKYFDHLIFLLKTTPRRTIVNYIHWRFINNAIKATTKRMENIHLQIIGGNRNTLILYPELSAENLRKYRMNCVKEIEMLHIMCYIFIKKYYPKEIQKEAEEIVGFLQDEVEIQIRQSKWPDEESKNIALAKVQNMKILLGFPDWYKNPTIMENENKGLIVGPSHFENSLNYRKFKMQNTLKRLKSEKEHYGKRERSETSLLIPIMLDALYSPLNNRMVVSAANFQEPFFALMRPSIINYGLIGSIIGHEISHGFDSQGHKYDKDGDRNHWNRNIENIFQERVKCFVDQFNQYTNSTKTNSYYPKSFGEITKDENIADSMGLEASLGGYYLSRKKNNNAKPVQTLPGFEELSPEKLFFLSYSISNCEVEKKITNKDKGHDSHSNGRLRVIGALSNSENFAKSFNCPIGSPMNPIKKCNIWN